jgi:hypothetical protein
MKLLNIELHAAHATLIESVLIARGLQLVGPQNAHALLDDQPEHWRRWLKGAHAEADAVLLQVDALAPLSVAQLRAAKAVLFAAFHARVKVVLLYNAAGVRKIGDPLLAELIQFAQLLEFDCTQVASSAANTADALGAVVPLLLKALGTDVPSASKLPMVLPIVEPAAGHQAHLAWSTGSWQSALR